MRICFTVPSSGFYIAEEECLGHVSRTALIIQSEKSLITQVTTSNDLAIWRSDARGRLDIASHSFCLRKHI